MTNFAMTSIGKRKIRLAENQMVVELLGCEGGVSFGVDGHLNYTLDKVIYAPYIEYFYQASCPTYRCTFNIPPSQWKDNLNLLTWKIVKA